MKSQMQLYEQARKFIAGMNEGIMEMVRQNELHPEDPDLTQEDLDALIERRPGVYDRFKGLRPLLPARKPKSNV
jgi:hypothetical protein